MGRAVGRSGGRAGTVPAVIAGTVPAVIAGTVPAVIAGTVPAVGRQTERRTDVRTERRTERRTDVRTDVPPRNGSAMNASWSDRQTAIGAVWGMVHEGLIRKVFPTGTAGRAQPRPDPRCSPGYEWDSYPLASMGRNVVWRDSLVLTTSIIERE